MRRVKCDQQRPTCQRCITSGRQCGGYEAFLIAKPTTASDGTLSLKYIRPSEHPFSVEASEQVAFEYFKIRLLQDIAGPFDPSLWYRVILPLTAIEPSIWHACLAVGASATQKISDTTELDVQHALRYYGKAIRALQHNISGEELVPIETTLANCLLFVAFEFLQEGWLQAQSHLASGLRIICEKGFKAGASSSMDTTEMDLLLQAFQRLDVQMSFFTSSSPGLYHLNGSAQARDVIEGTGFESIAVANRALQGHLGDMRQLVFAIETERFSNKCGEIRILDQFQMEAARQLIALKDWITSLNILLADSAGANDQKAGKILKSQYICCRLLISTCLTDGHELRWDRFLPDFERLLDLAEDALPNPASSMLSDHSHLRKFSIDMGVIGPLYFTALKCREPALRRRAITLLQTCNHQEGSWNGPICASLAASVVGLEEKGLTNVQKASDVPEQNRFYQAWYDLARTERDVLYVKRRCFEASGVWISYLERIR